MNEIEKKFLIKHLPENLETYPKVRIEQGYLNTDSAPTLRIRKKGQEYILCYKFKQKTEKQVASISKEVELPVTEEAYEHLKTKIDGGMIEKERYLIPLQDGLVAEIDLFDGFLKGLNVVEVEFQSEEDAANFKAPEWFGKDITFDRRFKNAQLCKILNFNTWFLEILKELENR